MEGDVITMNDCAVLEFDREDAQGRIVAHYKVSQARPTFLPRLEYHGLARSWLAAARGNLTCDWSCSFRCRCLGVRRLGLAVVMCLPASKSAWKSVCWPACRAGPDGARTGDASGVRTSEIRADGNVPLADPEPAVEYS